MFPLVTLCLSTGLNGVLTAPQIDCELWPNRFRLSTEILFSIIEARPKICMAQYGQAVSAQWLPLTGCRQMFYLMTVTEPSSLQTGVLNWPLIPICWPSDIGERSAFSSDSCMSFLL